MNTNLSMREYANERSITRNLTPEESKLLGMYLRDLLVVEGQFTLTELLPELWVDSDFVISVKPRFPEETFPHFVRVSVAS